MKPDRTQTCTYPKRPLHYHNSTMSFFLITNNNNNNNNSAHASNFWLHFCTASARLRGKIFNFPIRPWTARANPRPFYRLWRHQLTIEDSRIATTVFNDGFIRWFFAISLFLGISWTYVGFFQVNLAGKLLANLIQCTSGPIAKPIENTSEMTRIFNGGLKINQRKWPLTMDEKEWWWTYARHGWIDIKLA